MLTIDDKALAMIQAKNQPLSIDPVREFSGCCISVTESPGVHFGAPKVDPDKYAQHSVQGVTVYVPNCFPGRKLRDQTAQPVRFPPSCSSTAGSSAEYPLRLTGAAACSDSTGGGG